MATEVVKTVKASGGDYTSLAAWEAGEQRDLVTADEIAVAECYAFTDTSAPVTIAGAWTVDSTRYVHIRVPAPEQHNGGDWSSGPGGYTLLRNASWSVCLEVDAPYTKVDGVYATTTGANSNGFRVDADNVVFNRCIAENTSGAPGTSAQGFTWLSAGGANTFAARNCIARGFYYNFYPATDGTEISNCTSYGGEYGVFRAGNAPVVRNTIAVSAKTAPFEVNGGSWGAGTDHNLSDTATATGGANDLTNKSAANQFVSVTSGSEDLHLKSTADAVGAGADLSSLFTDDIDGDTRSAPWDMGADEYVSAGGGVTVTPAVAAAAGSVPGASVAGGALVGSAARAAAAGVAAPAVTGGALIGAGPAVAATAAAAASVSAGAVAAPARHGVSTSPQAPGVSGGALVGAGPVASAAAVQGASVSTAGGVTVTPAVAAATGSVPAASGVGGALAGSAARAAAAGVAAPAVTGGALIGAGGWSASAAVSALTLSTSAVVTAALWDAVTAVKRPSVFSPASGGFIPTASPYAPASRVVTGRNESRVVVGKKSMKAVKR
ncbi:MAG TPA: hypothetical protein ENJ37_03885 [Deltaproteobacteria bacterium]|nr:hypothetical protein [Deltaproteobacteria bacterium]